MPVRSLSSSVLTWPDQATVLEAVKAWASTQAARHPELAAVAVLGSYARGNWGVGSDLDIAAVVDFCNEPFERRGLSWDTSPLPVPTDLIVITDRERRTHPSARFRRTLETEALWVWRR